jgi:hypothetical protein
MLDCTATADAKIASVDVVIHQCRCPASTLHIAASKLQSAACTLTIRESLLSPPADRARGTYRDNSKIAAAFDIRLAPWQDSLASSMAQRIELTPPGREEKGA